MPTIVFRNISGTLLILTLTILLASACSGLFDDTPSLSQQALLSKLKATQTWLLVDVRSATEFRHGHLPGAINIDIRQLPRALSRLQAYQHNEVIVYCETGSRARHAIPVFKDAGFTQLELLDGDMGAWRRARLPSERGRGSPKYPPPAAAPAKPEPVAATPQ